MLNGKKIIVVMPAYNAAKTLEKTVGEIDRSIVDEVLLVDDASQDETTKIAKKLNIKHICHEKNLGYGGNQKTCYRAALEGDFDVVIMLHPDYQYDPKLLPAMSSMIASGVYDCVLGSRILGKGALEGGMPKYKYVANRFLTLFQNICLGQKLSEYHTGYRGFSKKVLKSLALEENSDNFVFDNEMLSQIIQANYKIGEISVPTKYFDEASSIRLGPSIRYGLGVLGVCLRFLGHRFGLKSDVRYNLKNINC